MLQEVPGYNPEEESSRSQETKGQPTINSEPANISKSVENAHEGLGQLAQSDTRENQSSPEAQQAPEYTIVTTDGRTYQMDLPENFNTEDIRQALRTVGANDLAEQVGSFVSSERKERALSMLRGLLNAFRPRLTPKVQSTMPSQEDATESSQILTQ